MSQDKPDTVVVQSSSPSSSSSSVEETDARPVPPLNLSGASGRRVSKEFRRFSSRSEGFKIQESLSDTSLVLKRGSSSSEKLEEEEEEDGDGDDEPVEVIGEAVVVAAVPKIAMPPPSPQSADLPRLAIPRRDRSQSISMQSITARSTIGEGSSSSNNNGSQTGRKLTRSLSQRIRRIASPAGDLVSDTHISTSWVAPQSKQISPRGKVSSPRPPSLSGGASVSEHRLGNAPPPSPRKPGRWPFSSATVSSGGVAATPPPRCSGNVYVLNSSQKWSKRFCRVGESSLEVFRRDKVSKRPSGLPKRCVALGGSLIRAEPDRKVMGRAFVLEIVSLSDGPVVLGFKSLDQLRKWTGVMTEASAKVATVAFPGIRLIEVEEEPPDVSWKTLVARSDGWRVELSTTPLDVTFGGASTNSSSTGGGLDLTEYARFFGDKPHTAWVGVMEGTGETFVALIAHGPDYSRMLVRTKLQDRLMEFVSTNNDMRLLKALSVTSELHSVANLASLRELDSIGAQNMNEYSAFKFGVLYTKGAWSEQEMFENCSVSPEYEEFLAMLGSPVQLEGFGRYAGGLDTSVGGAKTSGEQALFIEHHHSTEIMLHVAHWIPLMREKSSRVVQRKRHIANDVCVIVYCDDGVFVPALIKTKFIHVFIVVSKDQELSRSSGKTHYRVATVMRSGMPTFGPRLLRPPVYEKGPAFRDFLMSKCINGEKASKFAPDFLRQRGDLREWFLQKLLETSANAKH